MLTPDLQETVWLAFLVRPASSGHLAVPSAVSLVGAVLTSIDKHPCDESDQDDDNHRLNVHVDKHFGSFHVGCPVRATDKTPDFCISCSPSRDLTLNLTNGPGGSLLQDILVIDPGRLLAVWLKVTCHKGQVDKVCHVDRIEFAEQCTLHFSDPFPGGMS